MGKKQNKAGLHHSGESDNALRDKKKSGDTSMFINPAFLIVGTVVLSLGLYWTLYDRNTAWRAMHARRAKFDDEQGRYPSVYPPIHEMKGVGKRFSDVHPGATPLSTLSAEHNATMLWGSYTPANYFALRTRAPKGTVSGMMWFSAQSPSLNIRHLCHADDNIQRYGWTEHDGKHFGMQTISDTERPTSAVIETSFAKQVVEGDPDSWTAKVAPRGIPGSGQKPYVSILLYIAVEGATGASVELSGPPKMTPTSADADAPVTVTVKGNAPELNHKRSKKFEWTVSVPRKSIIAMHHAGVRVGDALHRIPDELRRGMRKGKTEKGLEYFALSDKVAKESNVIVVQATVKSPAVVSMAFKAGVSLADNVDTLATHSARLGAARDRFDTRFKEVFKIAESGFTHDRHLSFAKAAFSNMIGGMGYFYGSPTLRVPEGVLRKKQPKNPKKKHMRLLDVPGFDAPLFTAVPSRPFFPRGFLWDEGFHHLLISRYDRWVSLDSIGSWLGVMHANGWIPREQILGTVARTKVPDEFVAQHPEHANPPAMLLAIEQIFLSSELNPQRISDPLNNETEKKWLETAFPRLRAWFNWIVRGQIGGESAGIAPGSIHDIPMQKDGDYYYWRGRDIEPDQSQRINPRTLTSGLDDYPRALFPTDRERHVDLHSWVARGADIMSRLADLVSDTASRDGYASLALKARETLVPLHWDYDAKEFRDWGKHARIPFRMTPEGNKAIKRYVRFEEGRHGFVQVGPGYVSIFPFLLRVLDPSSDQLAAVLDIIEDPEHLWTPRGLRSISKKSPFYLQWNNGGDKPYWRGPIWLNANYLAATALGYYGSIPGPHASRANSLAARLAANLHALVWGEYRRRGFLFENYNDASGEGMGCYPFTGWTALIIRIMELGDANVKPDSLE